MAAVHCAARVASAVARWQPPVLGGPARMDQRRGWRASKSSGPVAMLRSGS